MVKTENTIKLDVPGILRLLGDHLYADPRIAIRELIQNAHDSIQRRLAESPTLEDYSPRIWIEVIPERLQILFHDNGSGLTESEVHEFLSTIGSSYSLLIKSSKGNMTNSTIGQFGMGLLSAFLVAETVEINTLSFHSDSAPVYWKSTGGALYTTDKGTRLEIGATVTLTLKPEGEFLLNAGILSQVITRYADLIPIPIQLNDDPTPQNRTAAPWHPGSDSADYRGFIAERTFNQGVLTWVPLENQPGSPKSDNNPDDIPLSGVLYVPDHAMLSVQEYGDATVYISRMFITDDERGLLPGWARFVRGIIESDRLSPTASREQIRYDEGFYQVKAAIEQKLLAHFRFLAQHESSTWRVIVSQYNDFIKGWGLESPLMFDAIKDLVLFESSRGRMTLPEYLSISPDAIYYFTETQGAAQEQVLYEARSIPVINAGHFAEEEFLEAYAQSRPEISLHQLGPGSQFLFSDLDPVHFEEWELVSAYYREQGVSVRLTRFDPITIPMLLVYPTGADLVSQARLALDHGDLSKPLTELVKEYLLNRDPLGQAANGTLHINVSNELMKRIIRLPTSEPSITAALELLYHNARFFAGRTLSVFESRSAFDMITYSVEELLKVSHP